MYVYVYIYIDTYIIYAIIFQYVFAKHSSSAKRDGVIPQHVIPTFVPFDDCLDTCLRRTGPVNFGAVLMEFVRKKYHAKNHVKNGGTATGMDSTR